MFYFCRLLLNVVFYFTFFKNYLARLQSKIIILKINATNPSVRDGAHIQLNCFILQFLSTVSSFCKPIFFSCIDNQGRFISPFFAPQKCFSFVHSLSPSFFLLLAFSLFFLCICVPQADVFVHVFFIRLIFIAYFLNLTSFHVCIYYTHTHRYRYIYIFVI